MIINEEPKLLGFERKMRLLKGNHNRTSKSKKTHISKESSEELLKYADLQLRKMGLKNV